MTETEPLFKAVIVPHRSLSRRGRRNLIGAIALICGLTGLRFVFWGAWPVLGFAAAEIGLATVLIQLNSRRARQTEMILLGEDGFRITRTDVKGRRTEASLPSAWARVALEERRGRVPALSLSARGHRVEIGAMLGEPEKRDLAAALAAALQRAKNPPFDNPQLAER
jgi:uncharacterized membrane protein